MYAPHLKTVWIRLEDGVRIGWETITSANKYEDIIQQFLIDACCNAMNRNGKHTNFLSF